ncbi:hypothetical protein OS493_021886 [Desmophyllum pertusum]|uniref:Uncharacterized protein n=1 Tax=Desmophyllum pertusum TaxID=174260 RepID=A0A9W9ZBD7_9CNID|nr:hypothetical protein OS493_021886 [Desmophyllum pertusum]
MVAEEQSTDPINSDNTMTSLHSLKVPRHRIDRAVLITASKRITVLLLSKNLLRYVTSRKQGSAPKKTYVVIGKLGETVAKLGYKQRTRGCPFETFDVHCPVHDECTSFRIIFWME